MVKIDGLTQAEAKQLLHKHTTGDWLTGKNRYATIKNLVKKGMLEYRAPYLYVTDLGRVWCDNNHMAVI